MLIGYSDIEGGKGNADALFINDKVPMPEACEGEAIVKIKAFGLNRMDLFQREGRYPVPPQASKILGVEFSGTIEHVNVSGSCQYKAGEEVFGLAYGGKYGLLIQVILSQLAEGYPGAYAEYIAVSTKMLLHKPKELSWETAAGIPEVILSGYCFGIWTVNLLTI